jgi:hypothetical protein
VTVAPTTGLPPPSRMIASERRGAGGVCVVAQRGGAGVLHVGRHARDGDGDIGDDAALWRAAVEWRGADARV